MSGKQQVPLEDDSNQRAWNHFCKTAQLEASERDLLQQQEKVKSVVDFYTFFEELQRKATRDLFDFDKDNAISVLSRARLRKAWLWLEEHPNLIGDAEAFCNAFDSSFVMEAIQLDDQRKRKREGDGGTTIVSLPKQQEALQVAQQQPQATTYEQRSRLASTVQPIFKPQFFVELCFNEIMVDPSTGMKYLELSSDDNDFGTSRIIIRACYYHMEPHIRRQLDIESRGGIVITGTPGIGKSVFGALLVRKFVQNQQSVVYWMGSMVYLFSWDDDVKRQYSLSMLSPSNKLYAGFWWVDSGCLDLLHDKRVFVIHDPHAHDFRVAHECMFRRVIFVLSHGHDLINHFTTKAVPPELYLYLPVWTLPEATNAARLLPFIHDDKAEETKTHDDKAAAKAEKLFHKFGGFFRAWRQSVVEDTEKFLREKVREVVVRHGSNILERRIDIRGSIVHLAVDFDASKPVLCYPTKHSDSKSTAPTAQMDEGDDCNDFRTYNYIFGSDMILEFVDSAITHLGGDHLKLCLHTWASETGFESIYGGLFELRCHHFLAEAGGKSRSLRARRVFKDGSNPVDFTITLPGVNLPTRYKGNDPMCLGDPEFEKKWFTVGNYFWPFSSNHPTYDAAFLVSGETAGESTKPVVPLLLQMTVSGATGLPRRPNHGIKQHVRKTFDHVFKKRIEGYVLNSAITTFVVPTECFRRFKFQPETIQRGEKAQAQPDFQLVIELPGMFVLTEETKKVLPKVASHKIHLYTDEDW